MDTESTLTQSKSASAAVSAFVKRKINVRNNFLKRSFDILFSLSVLILGSPVFALVALAVRFSSPGKIIFAQERPGRGGEVFSCYKFRTMYTNAEEQLKALLDSNEELRSEYEMYRKLKNDPRVTPIGAFLRKTSLDELPQFWNVLIGDLSVVGPRPYLRSEVQNDLGVKAYKILSVRPGITGIWQTSGRSNSNFETRMQLDEQYIDNRSLFFDIALVLKTIPAMLFSKGAY
jgi:exopolysaccharide production protein ExoY